MKKKVTQSVKSATIDEIEIDKDGHYVATGKEVTVKTTKDTGLVPNRKPGTYKVDIEKCLDRIVDKEPLFSHLVRKLTPVESLEINSTATDGVNLLWNHDFLSSMPENEQCGVLLHEVLHCAYLHLWRRGKRDMSLWNIATDYAINLIVNKTFPLPPGTLLDTQYTNMSAEEIYDRLPVKDIKQQGWCEKMDWEGQGQQKQGQGQQKQQQGSGGSGGNLVKKFVSDLANRAKRAAEQAARAKAKQKSASQKEAEWDKAFDQAFTQNYGRAPEYIKRTISKKHYIPVIDWAALVSKILSEDITDYTFSQPDRRFLDADFVLPELYSWDKVKDVIFAYDTSGSISNDDLNAFYQETIALWEHFPNLTGWAAVCDAYVHSFKEITPDTTYKEINFQGGGGTDFRPVFDEIEKRNLRPKALFYFTDTYGSYPDNDPGYPVFWLVHSYIGDNSNYESLPFGKVIKFMNRSQLNDPMRAPSRW